MADPDSHCPRRGASSAIRHAPCLCAKTLAAAARALDDLLDRLAMFLLEAAHFADRGVAGDRVILEPDRRQILQHVLFTDAADNRL